MYGRRHVGKCISADDVYSDFADNPLYLGCSANVLHLLDAKCSGRQQCQVRIPDAELEQTKPCLKDLKLFLEVRHHCVEGNALQLNYRQKNVHLHICNQLYEKYSITQKST